MHCCTPVLLYCCSAECLPVCRPARNPYIPAFPSGPLSLEQCKVNSDCTLFTLHCNLYTVHNTLLYLQFTGCTSYTSLLHCWPFTVEWTLYTLNCTLFKEHFTIQRNFALHKKVLGPPCLSFRPLQKLRPCLTKLGKFKGVLAILGSPN